MNAASQKLMPKQTEEQNRASEPQASVWVAASAGTGKTFVLTNRVLRILLADGLPEKILCLTFTKAAAAEMANRINKKLGEWVTCDQQLLCEQIMGLTGVFPTIEQQDHARKLFARVLEVPGGLKIQTIHSFCQSLLGRFPLEAGIAPHFQVMDERTALEHLGRARDAVLAEAQGDINPRLAQSLTHISRKVTENTFADLIGALINQRSGLERMMDRFRLLDQAIFAMRKMLGFNASDTRENIIAEACREDVTDVRLAVETLLTGSAANQKTAEVMQDWLANPEMRPKKIGGYMAAFLTKGGNIRKTLMPKKMTEASPSAFEAMTREAERLQKLAEKLKLMTLLENSTALLTIGSAMLEAFKESKKRHAVMDYDDLILKVSGLIGTSGIADWILYKLDGGVDHILIDEAQDTNPEQWQVIKALANEFFVGESRSAQTRTIFAVGDVKQSIYSFQRADPREFIDNRRIFQKKSSDVGHVFHNVNLALSFRSTAAVLNLVDRVFESPESRHALSFSQEEIIHEPSRVGHGGLVELWPTEPAAIVPEAEDWQPPVIQQPSKSPEMKLAIRIADKIAAWLDSGEELTSQARPITPGDIMILVRRRTKFDDYMIRALKARNIPVAGQDKMLLSEQIAVMDLMAVGNFTLLPSDDLTLAVVLKSPFIGFDEQDVFDLAYDRRGSLWSVLLARKSERDIFRRACDLLTALTNHAGKVPPFEFYSHLLTRLKGRENLLSRLGEEANDPIDEFLQLAAGYEANNISSLQGFLSWIDQGNVEIKRDMDQGISQVRIMTVHGAKGLQAPIVILPDSCQVPKRSSPLLWAGPKNEELLYWPQKADFELGPCKAAREDINLKRDQEYLRLLYVAMTRAEDRLYITGWEGKNARSAQSWYEVMSRALEAMATTEEYNITRGEGERDDFLMRLTCPQEVSAEENISAVEQAPPKESLPAWARALPDDEPSPALPLSPSRPAEEEPAVISPLLAARRHGRDHMRFHRGRLIHRLLEILPDAPPIARAQAAQDFLSQPAYDLAAADISQVVTQILGILNAPEFAALFSKASRAEVPVVGLVGTTAVSGVLDRLVVRDHEILVVDYKTNRPPPADVKDVPRIYLRQMAAYRAILSDIYPGKAIKCMLLWTDIAHLMELPTSALDRITF
ncbi:MAG: double-strand break repair helicase AddA [Emcibacter sp.]|nr:double-strand break repair helicase AddA [Emcibacter sp.]